MRILVERKNQLINLADLQAKPALLAEVHSRINDRIVAFQNTTPVLISLNPSFYQSVIELLFQRSLLPSITVEDTSRTFIARNISKFLESLRNNVAFNLIMNRGETPIAVIISVDLYELLFDRLEDAGLALSDVLTLAAEKQKDGSRQASVPKFAKVAIVNQSLLVSRQRSKETVLPINR